jgi:hypothetical protein
LIVTWMDVQGSKRQHMRGRKEGEPFGGSVGLEVERLLLC